ncbi:site-2 protease family protein [Candidatus Auribacterota bacterium]
MIIATIIIFLFAITIHEFAHGWVAHMRGDSTAMASGRLTLNPLAHIDIFGTVILPVMLMISGAPPFGYAKPVPVNFGNLRNPKKDMIWVGLAGPGANIIAAVTIGLVLKLAGISPLSVAGNILFYGMIINLYLAVFNLLPVPPLDGSRVVTGLLPLKQAIAYNRAFWFCYYFGDVLSGSDPDTDHPDRPDVRKDNGIRKFNVMYSRRICDREI